MSSYRTRAIRRSFTLAELLVVMMVIGILASSLLFAMYGAVQQAKEARTKAQIAKLHEFLMTRWDSYRTRAIRLNLDAKARRHGPTVAKARVMAIRDLMRMELPERKADVLDAPVLLSLPYSYTLTNSFGQTQVVNDVVNSSIAAPSVYREYRRRVANLVTPPNLATAAGIWTDQYQGAECLYLIIASMQDIMGNALDFFHDTEIGDKDGDGMPEVWDAWGNPIEFLRWPAGFVAHPGKDFEWGIAGTDDDGNGTADDFSEAGWPGTDDIPNRSNLHHIVLDPSNPIRVAAEARDPFDPLRVDTRDGIVMNGSSKAYYYFNYFLYPLVFSGGPDETLGIVQSDFDPDNPSTLLSFDFYRTGTNPHGGWMNDPYSVLPTSKRRLGEPFLDSDGYQDNITNHNLGD